MVLIAAHLNAGHSGGDSVVIGFTLSLPPPPYPLPPILPVPYGFCGRSAPRLFIYLNPFHLNLRACALDWRTRFAGSRGNASAGLLAVCITVFPWY